MTRFKILTDCPLGIEGAHVTLSATDASYPVARRWVEEDPEPAEETGETEEAEGAGEAETPRPRRARNKGEGK